jgi:hypothetical protein
MADDKRASWLTEFKAAGVEKVRSELLLRRWPRDKMAAAREWVEREDNKRWQAQRGPGEGAPVKRNRKWMGYVVGAAGLAFAAVRAFRFMRHGF